MQYLQLIFLLVVNNFKLCSHGLYNKTSTIGCEWCVSFLLIILSIQEYFHVYVSIWVKCTTGKIFNVDIQILGLQCFVDSIASIFITNKSFNLKSSMYRATVELVPVLSVWLYVTECSIRVYQSFPDQARIYSMVQAFYPFC